MSSFRPINEGAPRRSLHLPQYMDAHAYVANVSLAVRVQVPSLFNNRAVPWSGILILALRLELVIAYQVSVDYSSASVTV